MQETTQSKKIVEFLNQETVIEEELLKQDTIDTPVINSVTGFRS